MNRFGRRLLQAGLRGQVAGILLLGLALSQVIALILYVFLLPRWQQVLPPSVAVEKVGTIVQLLDSVAPAQRPGFAQVWTTADFRVAYAPQVRTLAASDALKGDPDPELRAELAERLDVSPRKVRVVTVSSGRLSHGKRIQVLLKGGGLLEIVSSVGIQHRFGLLEQIASAAFLCFSTVGLWIWLTWTVNAPLMKFAHAAERVGLDVDAPPLPEQGPAQLRRVIHAFNEMQVRLQRFLSDRTRMLGAIGHDLRTPLTRLRLRIETGRVAEEKAKMLADIESMEGMLSSALAFIRGVEEVESADVVDLDLLLQTVCDLVSDLGGEVGYSPVARCRYRCKPQAMLRALTNVVTNAAKYGERAHVALRSIPGAGYTVEVEDEGAGIPDPEKERVFEPFYRTASAVETDSQGMGLGLAIARSIILAHGGTIQLLDRKPHGLKVRIFLPEASAPLLAATAPPAARAAPAPGEATPERAPAERT